MNDLTAFTVVALFAIGTISRMQPMLAHDDLVELVGSRHFALLSILSHAWVVSHAIERRYAEREVCRLGTGVRGTFDVAKPAGRPVSAESLLEKDAFCLFFLVHVF